MLKATIGGKHFKLTKEEVIKKLEGEHPEPIQTYGVKIQGQVYPCKQVVATITGLPKAKFNAHHAYRILERLGFNLVVANTRGGLKPDSY